MVDVTTLHWPADEARRRRLEEEGAPRLLVIEETSDPPVVTDPLEDWIRLSAAPVDRLARLETLRSRAKGDPPSIDQDGLVRTDSGWVSVPPVEARLASLLIDNFGEVVSRDDLADAAWPGGLTERNALDVRILRLRRRLKEVGLTIRTVRSRGYLLEGPA